MVEKFILNPLTKRKIKVSGRVYNKLIREGVLPSEDIENPSKVEVLKEGQPPSLGEYILTLPDIALEIFAHFTVRELWKLRSLNKKIRSIIVDLVCRKYTQAPPEEFQSHELNSIAENIYLLYSVEELEILLLTIVKSKQMIGDIISHIYYQIPHQDRRKNEKVRKMTNLYFKYNAHQVHSVYDINNEETLMLAFRRGLNPLQCLKVGVVLFPKKLNVENFDKIKVASNHCFKEDITNLSPNKIKALLIEEGYVSSFEFY